MSVRNVIQAAAGAGGGDKLYVEDVFSTYLYTGNGSTQTITNSIDLSGEGGTVWVKCRSTVMENMLFDTARGTTKYLHSDTTNAEQTFSGSVTSFNSDGFSVGNGNAVNQSSQTFTSWTFRKAPKFFDVVTYTGNGATGRAITHSLGSVPGCIIVKRTDSSGTSWAVYHRTQGASSYGVFNLTQSFASGGNGYWYATPTSSVFYVSDFWGDGWVNGNGATYVAYLFAHDAGGFGKAGDQSIVNCGSFTHNGTSTDVNLGWEPQWFIIKRADDAGNWEVTDNMRSAGATGVFTYLFSNANFAESSNARGRITATGLNFDSGLSGGTYIYIAIRRGPMKTPEVGTQVFSPITYTGNGSARTLTTGFPVDFIWNKTRVSGPGSVMDRMRGQGVLRTSETYAESDIGTYTGTVDLFKSNTGLRFVSGSGVDGINESGVSTVVQCFRRAPGFFDIVCYRGTGSTQNISHNLGVAPELLIVKARPASLSGTDWAVYTAATGATNRLYLNSTGAPSAVSAFWNDTAPTATQFTVGSNINTNSSGGTYVAYLFASCPGVSKIGTVSIDSSGTLNVNCGFTSSARFVMLKRIDSTGDWMVLDTARGIVADNDPYLAFNLTNAENYFGANDNVDPYSLGFSIPMNTFSNLYGTGNYIYLAIA